MDASCPKLVLRTETVKTFQREHMNLVLSLVDCIELFGKLKLCLKICTLSAHIIFIGIAIVLINSLYTSGYLQ